LRGNKDILTHAVSFYKKLFGKEPRSDLKLGEDFWEDDERVSMEENDMMEADFSEEEILTAIKGSYAEEAPGPDGFSFLFYQKFWPIIKSDLIDVVKGFERGEVNMARLNFARIILIPKEEGANTLKKFRPISLINCSFKIFSKALNNRLEKVCERLLSTNQTAFVRGRYILESVMSAHEILHDAKKNKEKYLVIKLDYEKAYDRVD
jgi:hypothetical protein